jgi:hypothetical protein
VWGKSSFGEQSQALRTARGRMKGQFAPTRACSICHERPARGGVAGWQAMECPSRPALLDRTTHACLARRRSRDFARLCWYGPRRETAFCSHRPRLAAIRTDRPRGAESHLRAVEVALWLITPGLVAGPPSRLGDPEGPPARLYDEALCGASAGGGGPGACSTACHFPPGATGRAPRYGSAAPRFDVGSEPPPGGSRRLWLRGSVGSQ